MTKPIFAYGTLADKEFVERMLGHEVQFTTAFLDDYVRLEPNFFMVFPHEGSTVKGVLITGLSDKDIERFDRYEGNGFGYYERTPVLVRQAGGAHLDAESYVGGPHMQWFYQSWIENQASNN